MTKPVIVTIRGEDVARLRERATARNLSPEEVVLRLIRADEARSAAVARPEVRAKLSAVRKAWLASHPQTPKTPVLPVQPASLRRWREVWAEVVRCPEHGGGNDPYNSYHERHPYGYTRDGFKEILAAGRAGLLDPAPALELTPEVSPDGHA